MYKKIIVFLIISILLIWLVPRIVEARTKSPLVIAISPVVKNEVTLPDLIALEFKNTPKMVEIVKCESRFRQFDKNGSPLLSKTSDVGIMQINQVHWDRAGSLGLDIFNSVDDNIAMGKIILKEQGLNAWTCNKSTGRS